MMLKSPAIIIAIAAYASVIAPNAANAEPDTGGPARGIDTGQAPVSTNPNLAAPIVPPLIIIAPTEVRSDPTLAKGCWVRLFAQPDFKGIDDLTIAGPIALTSLHTPAGIDWKHKTESILVGPNAMVAIYENQNFRDRTATLKSGTQEPRLRGNLRFTQSIDSIKISCGH